MELPARRVVRDNVYEGFEDAVGNTPLIRLKRASEKTGCNIYGKCEFMNPGGSVKDRAALYLIKDAEERGVLTPGSKGIIVEGTAGNTGIGLALVAAARGYECVIVIPKTQSEEKKDMLRVAGAHLVEVPACPYKNPNNYVKFSGRLADKLGAVWAQQFDNTANRRAHIETTGPEVWAQTDGKVDAFSCAVGTGGTLAGVGMFLKSKKSDVKICLTDPPGAALYRYYTTGTMKSEGSSITEGIGQGRVTGNLEDFTPDMAFEVPDAEALAVLNDLLRYEGLALGTSSGTNVAGAIRVAEALGPGHTIVTVLCDLGNRYAGKIYSREFLESKNLPVPNFLANPQLPESVRTAVHAATATEEEVAAALGNK
eukprot:Plantae.Rhodophyta-Purpureofilum_apyrenoidigerum.ctg41501.p1 GENE.Plantae.Rhodophyta-Purpureofilum_apyrenoidigerum.ctg41501~~Plantae.Rhodophyta-Purpureofilum_apyrenoidigerum.ctg41501.p1  ORF type:complete len:369 (-),score=56.64 Plantae.Rhodophyta-Purpureofilum_apyrenoidigerum.ctg41501:641-1747(-)